MTMQLTDNQQALNKEEFITEYPKISQVLLDRTLDNLSQEDSIFIISKRPEKILLIWIRNKRFWKQSIRKLKQGM